MAINKESQSFTFIFSIIMVVVVATVLSLAAMGLKGPQEENMKQEKMQSILGSIQIETTREEANANFQTYVKNRLILNNKGEVVSELTGPVKTLATDGKEGFESDAFNIDIKNFGARGLTKPLRAKHCGHCFRGSMDLIKIKIFRINF